MTATAGRRRLAGETDRWLVALLALAVAVPPLVAAASLVGRHWFASADHALISLRVRDVGGAETPLVGLGSRNRWAHPGPALLWALAPFRWALGPTGLLAGAAALNTASAVGAVLVAHRRAGVRLAAIVTIVLLLLVRSLGTGFLIDPWNPFLPFFPFVFAVLATWAVWCGDTPLLVGVVVAGSAAVQSHVSYLPLVGTLLVLATVAAASSARRRPGHGHGAWLLAALVAGAAMWAAPVIEQLTADQGNLEAMVEFLLDPEEPAAGWETAFGVFGTEFHPLGAWVTGDDIDVVGHATRSSVVPAVLTFAALVAATAWAHRRGRLDAARLALLLVVLVLVAVVSSARVTGFFAPYLVRWWWAVTALAMAAAVHAVLPERLPAVDRRVPLVAAGGLLAACAAAVGASGRARLPEQALSDALGALAGPTTSALDGDATYLVRGVDSRSFGAPVPGLVLALEDAGLAPVVLGGDQSALGYGEHRIAADGAAGIDGIVTIIARSDLAAGQAPPEGAREIASYDPLSASERAREVELDAQVRASLGSDAPAGPMDLRMPVFRDLAVEDGASSDEVEELARLQARGDGYVVYLSRP